MFAGNRNLAGKQVKNVYEKALELKARNILITECGHAYRSLAFEGPYLAGYPDGKPPVEIVHYVQLIYEYLRDGRIKIDPKKSKNRSPTRTPAMYPATGVCGNMPAKSYPILPKIFEICPPTANTITAAAAAGALCRWDRTTNPSAWLPEN
jgi:hypothetical protein